jgi:hypothetical protein
MHALHCLTTFKLPLRLASRGALMLSAERLAFSCEAPRERSDRGPRQLQRPSYATPLSVSIPLVQV